jgi:DNA-binding NarL/FixJ family response regulator
MSRVSKANGTRLMAPQSRTTTGSAVSGVSQTPGIADRALVTPRLLIVSNIRFLREGLAEVLGRDHQFQITGAAQDFAQALDMTDAAAPDIILIDTALPEGPAAAERLRERAPQARLVALAIGETEVEIITWATAGVCGYIPRNAGLSELVGVLKGIVRGEQTCPSHVAGGLLRWIAKGRQVSAAQPDTARLQDLTAREQQVILLIGAGLSNKEIARRLDIGLATTKSHVHNLLGKVGLARRSQVAHWLYAHGLPHGPPWANAGQAMHAKTMG